MSWEDEIIREICDNCILRYDCTADVMKMCLSINKNLDLLKREIKEAVYELSDKYLFLKYEVYGLKRVEKNRKEVLQKRNIEVK